MPERRIALVAVLTACLLGGCHRREEGVFIVAPFNDETKIAKITAGWEPAAVTADGKTLHFQVKVENRLGDRLYVRLGGFRLTRPSGDTLANSEVKRECVIAGGATSLVLEGDLGSPGAASNATFSVDHFGVPLSERGRSIYREFLLQSEKYTAAEIDAALAHYENTPPCG